MSLTTPRFFVEDIDEEVPESIPRHKGNSRPKIRHADDPTKMSYWIRASSFAERVDDMFRLDRYNERLVARGMAISPDLCELVAALPGLEEAEDKKEATRIANLAKTAAGGDRKANRGTALHKLRQRLDDGEDLAFVGPQQWEALQAWITLTEPFTLVASETFVVNDRWKAAGSFDAEWEIKPRHELVAPDGTIFSGGDRLGGDLKSGNHIIDLGELERAVQQAVYFCGGTPYIHVPDEDAARGDNGRSTWHDGRPPSPHWSLIPHVPLEHPEDAALWWVDLDKAARIADAVAGLWELRKTEGLIVPAEPPRKVEQPVSQPVDPVAAAIAAARSEGDLERAWQVYADSWHDEYTMAARERLAELSAGTTDRRTS